jgi:hypothetical protein
MSRRVVVLLDSSEGRGLVRRLCRSATIPISTLEELVNAELDQQGKKRKAGLWEEFDRIFDGLDADREESA